MRRRNFLLKMAGLAVTGAMMNHKELEALISNNDANAPMPAVFAGHGSPMNAIGNNEFTGEWRSLASSIPVPQAILCISAHWETRGTYITAMEHPKTIHDFYGFPDELFAVQYPAPGNPELAGEIEKSFNGSDVRPDSSWGLDHGTWSILRHMYPKANIPVLQLSLDFSIDPEDHIALARKLGAFRKRGVLILGSGNMVHNLRLVDWKNQENGHDWAIEANETLKRMILNGNLKQLGNYRKLGSAIQLAIPTPEHFYPLLYILALRGDGEEITVFNDRCVMGSVSMTSFKIF